MDQTKRLYALDALRGLDLALMIIVNTPGDGSMTFSPLEHADWFGCTLTDLVFPTFLFIVGASMAFSLPAAAADGTGKFVRRVLRRTVILFLLGYLMYWFPFVDADGLRPFDHTRIFGVLQRIALCYCASALLIHFAGERAAIWFSMFALLGYWLILVTFGDLTLTGNAVLMVDRWLVGDAHLYMGNGVPFDPEGLLSTLPAVVNVVAGYVAARWLIRMKATWETVSMLMIYGAVVVLTAVSWDLVFPFSKKLWTSSFALYAIGMDLMVLGVLVYWLDIRQQRAGSAFFVTMGRNPIVVYLFSELLAISLNELHTGGTSWFNIIYQSAFAWLPDYFASLAFAICFMMACWLVAYLMERRKWYIRV